MLLESKPINIDDLLLDLENPRLPSYLSREQDDILKFLAHSSSIDELISAIGSNDYFKSEPLIAVPMGNKYNVIEGNRRLTALKIMNGANFEGMSKRLSDAVGRAKYKPIEAPVDVYESRKDILNYLGNKHIAGVKPWGALAKARYAKQLSELMEGGGTFQERAKNVAMTIGSRSDFITRSLKALNAYEIAEENNFFNLEGIDEEKVKFSLLSTALDYEGIQSFVYENPEAPVDKRKILNGSLTELFAWMFESDSKGKTKLGESRNLIKLSNVVADEKALHEFRMGLTLDQAYALSGGLNEEFDNLTTKVLSGLRDANSIVADVENTEDREAKVISISKQARVLKQAVINDGND